MLLGAMIEKTRRCGHESVSYKLGSDGATYFEVCERCGKTLRKANGSQTIMDEEIRRRGNRYAEDTAQGPAETDEHRAKRTPSVLRAYARDIERYGKPLDSGLPGVLEFAARWIEKLESKS